MNMKQIIRGENNSIFGLGEDNKLYRWIHHGGIWERFWRDITPEPATPVSAPVDPAMQVPAFSADSVAPPAFTPAAFTPEAMPAVSVPDPITPQTPSARIAEAEFGQGGLG